MTVVFIISEGSIPGFVLLIIGQGTGPVTSTIIAGVFSGSFNLLSGGSGSCTAADHRFTFTRR